MTKHTPGPWRWWLCKDGSYDSNNDYVQVAGRPEHVAQIRIASVSEADLCLIAAAPDLLEALRTIVKSLSDQDDEGMIEHAEPMIRARAAIQKATKEQQRV